MNHADLLANDVTTFTTKFNFFCVVIGDGDVRDRIFLADNVAEMSQEIDFSHIGREIGDRYRVHRGRDC